MSKNFNTKVLSTFSTKKKKSNDTKIVDKGKKNHFLFVIKII